MKGKMKWLIGLGKPAAATLRAAAIAAAAGLPAAAVLAVALLAVLPPDVASLFVSFCKAVVQQLPLP